MSSKDRRKSKRNQSRKTTRGANLRQDRPKSQGRGGLLQWAVGLSIVIGLVILGGILALSRNNLSGVSLPPSTASTNNIAVGSESIKSKGKSDAPVLVEEYGDFQ